MLVPGVVSVSFRKLKPEEIILLAAETQLKGIEWGGDIHVPHGNLKQAMKVGKITYDHGLESAAYGSYYRIGESEANGLTFESILATAIELRTKIIRVWAGIKDSKDADERYWQQITDDSKRIGDMAAEKDIKIVYEFHYGTLTDTYESCKKLLERVNHPNVFTYWQPRHGEGAVINSQGIDHIFPWIRGVHVFHWLPELNPQRYLLEAGAEDWKVYFKKLQKLTYDIYTMLEFTKDDDVQNFKRDAKTLIELINKMNYGNSSENYKKRSS